MPYISGARLPPCFVYFYLNTRLLTAPKGELWGSRPFRNEAKAWEAARSVKPAGIELRTVLEIERPSDHQK